MPLLQLLIVEDVWDGELIFETERGGSEPANLDINQNIGITDE
jgi:hypothetical protein